MKIIAKGRVVKKKRIVKKVTHHTPKEEPAWCPDCLTQGLKSKMKTFQLSPFHAAWQCENMQCSYPLFTDEIFGLPFLRDYRNMDDPLKFPEIFYGPLPEEAYKMLNGEPFSLSKVFPELSDVETELSPDFGEDSNEFSLQDDIQIASDNLIKELEEVSSRDDFNNNEDQVNGEETLYDLLDSLDTFEGTNISTKHKQEPRIEDSVLSTSFQAFTFESSPPKKTRQRRKVK